VKASERQRLVSELDEIDYRLRTHAFQVAYSRRARSLSEHIADTKRRDVIEALLASKSP